MTHGEGLGLDPNMTSPFKSILFLKAAGTKNVGV